MEILHFSIKNPDAKESGCTTKILPIQTNNFLGKTAPQKRNSSSQPTHLGVRTNHIRPKKALARHLDLLLLDLPLLGAGFDVLDY